ncbi:MAG: uroporphyrinogen-III synthase [Gammaproteobacteria bacterium]|nr:uroporphyrinogen III synthase [Gammaproteobacteria bacterium]
MIPKIIPPLTGLSVLVTRPAAQTEPLCAHIERLGGIAVRFPTILIEPQSAPPAEPCDLVVFASVNAVALGHHLLAPNPTMKIAAIGRATAAALKEVGLQVDYVPDAGFTSEALLAHPDLQLRAGMRVLIVRGEGGRTLMQTEFAARGLHVETREVYRRVRPQVDPAVRDALEMQWSEDGVDVVTLTSVSTLDHLREMLSERGRALLERTPVLVVSARIAAAARAAGLKGDILLAPAADDASIVGTLALWHSRARA